LDCSGILNDLLVTVLTTSARVGEFLDLGFRFVVPRGFTLPRITYCRTNLPVFSSWLEGPPYMTKGKLEEVSPVPDESEPAVGSDAPALSTLSFEMLMFNGQE
jgi:hypothetical protein